MEPKKLGLMINPIAGMGGAVGLKGTDQMVAEARRRGAVPMANQRARIALTALLGLRDQITVYTCPGGMGGALAQEMGFSCVLLPGVESAGDTTSADTLHLARQMAEIGIDLLLFAGGDGTARDIYTAVGTGLTVLGIPAGVKIHSPVYARTPSDAGRLARRWLEGGVTAVQEAEVLDIDEDLYRREVIDTRLYGYLKIPLERGYTQNRKAGTPLSEAASIDSIAHELVGRMEPGVQYLIGAGTTTRGVMRLLGLKNTLIGVDLVLDGKLLANDLYGRQMLEAVRGKKTRLIVTVTGGQGFLFGRGNQQITPEVIRELGRENILIAATREKLFQLRGQPLLVDTGDPLLDQELRGFYRVTTSYGESMICEVR